MQIELNTDEIILLEELLLNHRLDVLKALTKETTKQNGCDLVIDTLVKLNELNKNLINKITGECEG